MLKKIAMLILLTFFSFSALSNTNSVYSIYKIKNNEFVFLLKNPVKSEFEVNFLNKLTKQKYPAKLRRAVGVKNCYAIMIDNSESMKEFHNDTKKSAIKIIKDIPSSEYFSVFVFSENIKKIIPYTDKKDTVIKKINNINITGKNTQLFLSVDSVLDTLEQCEALQKHIIIFSDGDAEDRATMLTDVITKANKEGVRIHTIGFGRREQSGTVLKLSILKKLSSDSDGNFNIYEDNIFPFWKNFLNHSEKNIFLIKFNDSDKLLQNQNSVDFVFNYKSSQNEKIIESLEVLPNDSTHALLNSLEYKTGLNKLILSILIFTLLLIILLLSFLFYSKNKKLKIKNDKRLESLDQKISEQENIIKSEISSISNKLENNKATDSVMGSGQPYGQLVGINNRSYDLVMFSTKIGRSNLNDIVILDESVSREHAIIDFKKGKFYWTDRAPLNRSIINNEVINESYEIKHNDVIICGEVQFKFVLL